MKKRLLGNGELASLARGPFAELYKIEDEDKIEEEVIGEQGLAALALGTFEEEYKIEGESKLKKSSELQWTAQFT